MHHQCITFIFIVLTAATKAATNKAPEGAFGQFSFATAEPKGVWRS